MLQVNCLPLFYNLSDPAMVEHSFFYIKRVFGYSKVRYRGLSKNSNRLHVLVAFSNLLMARKYPANVGKLHLLSGN